MKATDLMIGDWYYWKAEGKMYPYQVTAEDFVKGEISNFQPIPLTPKIFEKNGFSHKNSVTAYMFSYVEYRDNKGDFDLYICNGVREGSSCGEINEFQFTAIRYVHEFQHALKLCKIEKEIVL